jgi:hypothetical protein
MFILLIHFTLYVLVNRQSKDYGVIGATKNYTEFTFGTMNLLISVAHDGTLKPSSIADRDTAGNDVGTRSFAQSVIKELTSLFSAKYGKSLAPFTIFNNLDRRKIDVNRGEKNGNFCKYTDAVSNLTDDCYQTWVDFHQMIQRNFVTNFMLKSKYAQGLVIDLHGQPIGNRGALNTHIELGYNLDTNVRPLSQNILSKTACSITNLVNSSPFSFDDLIRGNHSLGGIIYNKFKLNVTPSPMLPNPPANVYTHQGGYISSKWGSYKQESRKNRLNAIQIEVPLAYRQGTMAEVNAMRLASCIFDFYEMHSLGKPIS